MAIPTTYGEATLKSYMHATLGPVATTLDWSIVASSYDEAVNEAVAACDVDDIATLTGRDNIRMLRAFARREVWRAVMQATASHYDVSADGASMSRSQIYQQAKANFALAEMDCLPWSDAYAVESQDIDYSDPYMPPNVTGTEAKTELNVYYHR